MSVAPLADVASHSPLPLRARAAACCRLRVARLLRAPAAAMTLYTRTSAALDELEAAFAAAAAADAPPPPKATTDGWAASLAALAPSVAKMKATALETDPDKQLYAPAMRDKVLALATRLEAAQAALQPLQVRVLRAWSLRKRRNPTGRVGGTHASSAVALAGAR